MSLPEFTMRQLIECGVHYGHQSHRWNPLMGEFIHSKRNGIHIIDLTKTIPMLDAALQAMFETVSKGGSVLFVGTKRQAQKPVSDAAVRCAQFYINQRWLGGTLTNWHTVSNSIDRLKAIDERLEGRVEGLTKRELLGLTREQSKLQASLGGIRDMKSLPDMLFVVDVKKEAIAVAEAKKLGIPVVAIVDTNCSPDGVTFLVPGNDDASRAINLYCDLFARAALAGLQQEMSEKGEDPGELSESGHQAVDGMAVAEATSEAGSDGSGEGDSAREEAAVEEDSLASGNQADDVTAAAASPEEVKKADVQEESQPEPDTGGKDKGRDGQEDETPVGEADSKTSSAQSEN